MDCIEFRKHLDDYIDNTLPNELVLEMDRHACACEFCYCELKRARILANALHNFDCDYPSGLHDEIEKRVKTEAARAGKRWYTGPVMRIAAAIVILAVSVPIVLTLRGGVGNKTLTDYLRQKGDASFYAPEKEESFSSSGNLYTSKPDESLTGEGKLIPAPSTVVRIHVSGSKDDALERITAELNSQPGCLYEVDGYKIAVKGADIATLRRLFADMDATIEGTLESNMMIYIIG